MAWHAVEVHVGTRMKQRRVLLGMSQTKLGTAVGLTYQQVQKYERGANRVSSSHLYELAKALDVPVSYFFDEMPPDALSESPVRGRQGYSKASTFGRDKDPLTQRETLEFVRGYYKIREVRVRKSVFEMIKAMGDADR